MWRIEINIKKPVNDQIVDSFSSAFTNLVKALRFFV